MIAALSKRLKTLADPMRLRLLNLLVLEELTVTELTRILSCGQSRVSGHLARLSDENLVVGRREGRFLFYSGRTLQGGDDGALWSALIERASSTEEASRDREALATVLAERPHRPPPGTLGKDYLAGRTWEGFAKALLQMLAPRRVADLGLGQGDISLLLAETSDLVIAVDRDPAALDLARERAELAGLADRISFRSGDLCDPPIEEGEVDVWLLSQVLHLVDDPARALRVARERLAEGGVVVVLELLAHGEAWVGDRLGHRHLGFTEAGLHSLVEDAGFEGVSVRRAARDRKPPHFVSLLASGRKPR